MSRLCRSVLREMYLNTGYVICWCASSGPWKLCPRSLLSRTLIRDHHIYLKRENLYASLFPVKNDKWNRYFIVCHNPNQCKWKNVLLKQLVKYIEVEIPWRSMTPPLLVHFLGSLTWSYHIWAPFQGCTNHPYEDFSGNLCLVRELPTLQTLIECSVTFPFLACLNKELQLYICFSLVELSLAIWYSLFRNKK